MDTKCRQELSEIEYIQEVKNLISEGADVNERDNYRNTPSSCFLLERSSGDDKKLFSCEY